MPTPMNHEPIVRIALALALLSAPACDKSPEPTGREPALPAPSSNASSPAGPAPMSARIARPGAPRIVAIGDLHGDLDAARKVLRLAGAIDANDAWAGDKLVVVQTGDQIDRGDDDRKILELFERLQREAKAKGGEVIALNGNHELMNVAADFRYVTPGSDEAFGGRAERQAAFAPGGTFAKMLAERPIFVKVGDSVFVHGGILPKHVAYGLDRLNDETRAWLTASAGARLPTAVMAEDGPVWTRTYSAAPSREDCATLGKALAQMGAKRMIMGHTVQRGGISSACDEKAWRIDVGMSRFYQGPIEALEITGDTIKVLRGGA
jgi:hypothetical protein